MDVATDRQAKQKTNKKNEKKHKAKTKEEKKKEDEKRQDAVQEKFWKAVDTEGTSFFFTFKSEALVHPKDATMTRPQSRQRVISSRFVLRWKANDSEHIAQAGWCVHGVRTQIDMDKSRTQ